MVGNVAVHVADELRYGNLSCNLIGYGNRDQIDPSMSWLKD